MPRERVAEPVLHAGLLGGTEIRASNDLRYLLLEPASQRWTRWMRFIRLQFQRSALQFRICRFVTSEKCEHAPWHLRRFFEDTFLF